MRQARPNARAAAKDASHERIVAVAARAIRKTGYHGTGVAAALGSEMPRQAPEIRRAVTCRTKEMVDLVARQSPDWEQPGAHEQA